MEILLWLVPTAVVTVAAMVWVSWVGRDGHGEVDRDVAVERLGKALAKELPAGTPAYVGSAHATAARASPYDPATGPPRRASCTRRAS